MEIPELEKANGAPAWMATFADLMSLLLCFFVLLFSFSQIDALKFKQIAGSMKMGFGVQREVPAEEIPLGTSAVLDQFSPGQPTPTPFDVVKQNSQQPTQPVLQYTPGETDASAGHSNPKEASARPRQVPLETFNSNLTRKKIEQRLEQYIENGAMELDDLGQQLIIRIKENGAFPSGSAYLQNQFKPVLTAVGEALVDIPGAITVAGHSDNTRVNTELFQNNWDLSASRAVAVASVLEQVPNIQPNRIEVKAYADKKPLVANDNAENRSINRRVEIAISQGEAKEVGEVTFGNEE